MPIDILTLRESRGGNPEIVKALQAKRFKDDTLVDRVVALDKAWVALRGRLDGLAMERNELQNAITERKKKENLPPTDEQKERMKNIKIEEKVLEQQTEEARIALEKELPKIGNFVHDSVPVSNDEEKDTVVVRTWGTPRSGDDLESHSQLLWRIGGYDPDAGAKTAGHRGYYLTGPGVLLNQALINYGLAFLVKRSYVPVQPPYFMNKKIMTGVAQLEEFDEALYHVVVKSRTDKTEATNAAVDTAAAPKASSKQAGGGNNAKDKEDEDEDKYLIATSEQPICALHMDQWMSPDELPKMYAGISTCFRKEAGKHGRDTWGIFRVHQFDKVEQFALCAPEDSWRIHEEMLQASEEFLQSLEIPYRVINIVSGELNNAAAKKYDIEGWFPNYGEFKELVSCSNCTDYQSRAMEIRYGLNISKDSEGRNVKQYVHMLNGTLCALTRTICVILETFQGEKVMPDGTVVKGVHIPATLVPYMAGVDFLPFVREARENLNDPTREKKPTEKGTGAKSTLPPKRGTYMVGKDVFKTSIKGLIGRKFPTMQEYVAHLKTISNKST